MLIKFEYPLIYIYFRLCLHWTQWNL